MPRYRFEDGTIQTLSRRTAKDVAAGVTIREVDVTGELVPIATSALATAIDQLRAHEQVAVLQAALDEAKVRVREIETQLVTATAAAAIETETATAEAAAQAHEAAAQAQRDADADELLHEK